MNERPAIRLRSAAVPALVVAAALACRLTSWPEAFTPEGPRLVGDSDPHYHVLRAERWLSGLPDALWRDPALDWPHGATIPWPPLFSMAVAAAGRLLAGAEPDRLAIAGGAAWLPVALGLLAVLLVGLIARRTLDGRAGGRPGWIAAGLVAVLPVAVEHSRLGRVDQHAAEIVLFCSILLVFLAALREPARWPRHGAALALLAALAFWTWMGSALHLAVPLLAAGAWHVLAPEGDRAGRAGLATLALGGLGGAALLSASLAAFAPPGALASAGATSVTGLHAAVLACAGAWAALLLLVARHGPGRSGPGRRLGEALLAAAAAAAPILAAPALRAGAARGLAALAAANPWYASIEEFRPLLDLGVVPPADALLTLSRGYGLVHLAALAGLAPLARRWRESPEDRPPLLVLAAALALLVPASLALRRLGPYAVVPLAVAGEAGLRAVASAIAARAGRLRAAAAGPAALVAASLLAVAPALPEHLAGVAVLDAGEEEALRFLRGWPARPGGEAVLAPWSLGHLVQFFGERPVVASPFGTEGGAGALEDTAAFWFAAEEAQAEQVLARRRAGLVLLASVPVQALHMRGFAPPGTAPALQIFRDPWRGQTMDATPAFWRMVPNRLYYRDGAESEAGPALDGFRLLHETPATSPADSAQERQWMLFERVPGARVAVRGAARARVRASIPLQANTGRAFEWAGSAVADPAGEALLRLPYASGPNGAVRGGPWTVGDGARSVTFVLHEEDVVGGRGLEIDLAHGSVRRTARAPTPPP